MSGILWGKVERGLKLEENPSGSRLKVFRGPPERPVISPLWPRFFFDYPHPTS